VAHEPLDAVHVDALAQELRRESMSQVVEAHLERQRLRPEEPAAYMLCGLASAVRALQGVVEAHDLEVVGGGAIVRLD
jgi:hypothetical protein